MNPQKTTIDWLRLRVKAQPSDIVQALKPMFDEQLQNHLHLSFLNHGLLGFKQGAQIMLADVPVGRMDYGGDSQAGWVRVDMPSKGCEQVTDWDAVSNLEDLPYAQIRRLDLALTTWGNEVNHQYVVDAHGQGRFITRGRPPVLSQITSSDPTAGKTCYIGKREQSDKFMRCYEKGYEMATKFQGGLTHIDGVPLANIYRCEVELKAANTDIPWEVIERRDHYFAGAYPFCADILPNIETDILKRRPEREAQMSLAAALGNLQTQYGATLFTALAAYGGDFMAVWDKVCGDHHNQNLLEAGVLLVEHE
jgi:DNA relaxase NicK